jgi:hypothetical protein
MPLLVESRTTKPRKLMLLPAVDQGFFARGVTSAPVHPWRPQKVLKAAAWTVTSRFAMAGTIS